MYFYKLGSISLLVNASVFVVFPLCDIIVGVIKRQRVWCLTIVQSRGYKTAGMALQVTAGV